LQIGIRVWKRHLVGKESNPDHLVDRARATLFDLMSQRRRVSATGLLFPRVHSTNRVLSLRIVDAYHTKERDRIRGVIRAGSTKSFDLRIKLREISS
jgi:hypothetical protein